MTLAVGRRRQGALHHHKACGGVATVCASLHELARVAVASYWQLQRYAQFRLTQPLVGLWSALLAIKLALPGLAAFWSRTHCPTATQTTRNESDFAFQSFAKEDRFIFHAFSTGGADCFTVPAKSSTATCCTAIL